MSRKEASARLKINKLALQGLYKQHKEAYVARRMSGDTSQWDEAYKWDLLPELNQHLSKFGAITEQNVADLVKVLQDNNPQNGSFCHWSELDTLSKQVAAKPVLAKALNYAWSADPSVIGDEINNTNDLLNNFFSGSFKLGPATYGYMLASKDCENYALFHSKILNSLVEIQALESPTKQGDKYQLVNDSACYIGSLMNQEKDAYSDRKFYTALNGQDFLWVMTNKEY